MTSDQPERPLRLLVVDDHEVVRQGLVALLDRRDGFEVVAQAGTVAEAIGAGRALRARPGDHGRPPARWLRHRGVPRHPRDPPATRVVMLTSYPDEEAVLSAIIAGASGYLLKQIRGRDLVSALEAVGRGESLLDPAVTEKVLERVRRVASGRRPTSWPTSPPRSARSCCSWPRGRPTRRSPPRSSSPTRRSRTTSAASCRS